MAVEQAISHEARIYLDKTAPVVFLILTPEGRIAEANRFAETLAGHNLTGTPFTDFIIDFGVAFDPAILTADSSREYLLSIQTRSRLPQSFYFSFKPVHDRVLVFGRLDAEEIENTRKEVQSLNQELNNLTRALHKSNAQLQALNELKNQFLGMAAHDLRKPVSVILSYSEFLIDEAAKALTDEQARFLQIIHTSTALMRNLIDDFLDVSLIESGQFHVDLEKRDIREPVDRCLALMRLPAQKRNVTLQVVYDGPIPEVMMDGFKIEQVLNNLVGNAVEHSPPHTEVTVQISQYHSGLSVAVRDSGPGIGADEMERLFAPYARGQARKASGTRSTGLGLSISKKIIDAHNGKIWVESRPGEGSTFYFNLPAVTSSNGEKTA
jgi:signal transduction histidine kinase